MARTKAISLIQSGSTKVDLAELSGLVISNIQKDTLSQGLKSQAYTGNPASGSVEFKRFKNSASQPYGTARTAGKGDAITVPPTTVNLNTHKEIVEEAAKFDLDTFGVGNIMARRADNHVDTVASEFDTAFFAQAKAEGTSYTPASDAGIEDLLEGIIQTLESVKNDYVRGVPRNMIRLVLDPLTYGKARNYLDKSTNNANVDTAAEDFAIFHGVRVYSSINLPVTSEATSDSKTKTTTVHAIIGLLSLVGTLAGTYFAHRKSSALIAYRLEQLEKKVELHNNAVERLYKVEKALDVYEEKMKVANHRIEDLEHHDQA